MSDNPVQYTRGGKVYLPAVTPGLRKLLIFIASSVSILGANSVYLAAITFLGYWKGTSYENQFYLYMFLLHLALGLVMTVPFVVFGIIHIKNTLGRKNRKAVRGGYYLFVASMAVILSGYWMMFRLSPAASASGRASYWIHVLGPIAAIAFYVAHRLYGPRLRWKWGLAYAAICVAFGGGMAVMHSADPREWNKRGGGEAYFEPSMARTANGAFIPPEKMMMDEYCQECHPDAYRDHQHSMHRVSSFNNPPYNFSVRETRRVAKERDGSVHAARWCAGCHDPVPFFSGAFEEKLFDEPEFDPNAHPTATAGITCTACHAITNINSTIGNADYTIEEPLHYPFADSKNGFLHTISNQLVKAKPDFHKKTFLKPLHKSSEFCSTCHKVSLPFELNHYKEWTRGQNHYDSYFLSGMSGNFAASFYYPPKAFSRCAECHMPKLGSQDFGAVAGMISNHRFTGANTGIPAIMGDHDQVEFQRKFLTDQKVRIDIFGVKEGGTIDGRLIAPLRPAIPALEPGKSYLIESVIRTLAVGHVLTQGTVDSNELWVEVEAKIGDRVVGRSGHMDPRGEVDRFAFFANALIVDRNGDRINRRNAQDIFTAFYDHQTPPGAATVVHYGLRVPEDAKGSLSVRVKFNYRKFDREYMELVYKGKEVPELPIVMLAEDQVEFPIGSKGQDDAPAVAIPEWMRWNDYGIALLREGDKGSNKGELKQAEVAFQKVTAAKKPTGWVNLGRVYYKEGRLDDARQALTKAVEEGVDTPWTAYWFAGLIDKDNGHLEAAVEKFEKVLAMKVPERGFDFSKDYVVRAESGRTMLQRAIQARGDERRTWLDKAIKRLESVLELDSENVDAHHNLHLAYGYLGDEKKAAAHKSKHETYRIDDNAKDTAIAAYRKKNPAADRAAEAIVIYDLQRDLP